GKRSACFSKRSESIGDSNFPDNSSDLSDGQIGVNPRLLGAALLSGERFTMDGEAGCTTKDGSKLSFVLNAFEEPDRRAIYRDVSSRRYDKKGAAVSGLESLLEQETFWLLCRLLKK
ncbi:hypothetical protein, partial [Paraglaciecola chathamensis]|uniref:hypothetical protein n=1 Tax=Paraglaciecola chathamensis TaxID=368405 RepID=UPI000586A54E